MVSQHQNIMDTGQESPRGCDLRREEPVCVEPSEHAKYVTERQGRAAPTALRNVLLLYQGSALRRLSAAERVEEPGRWVSGRLLSVSRPEGVVAVCGEFGIGAPAAGLVVEQLVALGARRIIAVGTAGSLQPSVEVGDEVLCDRAVRAEGVSHRYWFPGKYSHPSPSLTRLFGQELVERQRQFHRGASWTTDTPYRETRVEADQYAAEGVLTVDMEAAAVFAVARYRGVECAAAFAVSDSLVAGRRVLGERSEATARSLDLLADAALSALLSNP